MRVAAVGLTDVGRERTHNEDKFLLLPEQNVFVVADGMGGHNAGEVAARMAASTIASYFKRIEPGPKRPIGERLRAAVIDANAKIHARADDSRSHRGMGTTVVVAAFAPEDGVMHVAHVGDSRCYRFRKGQMTQLTRDHSLVADALLERPDLSANDLAYLPRNVITRALGISSQVEVDLASERAEVGDLYLMCTDGLHGLVHDAEITGIVNQAAKPADCCARLIERANFHGGKDNITAVLLQVE